MPLFSKSVLIACASVFLVATNTLTANDTIAQRMSEVVPSTSPDLIEPSAMPGLFEVRYGSEILYVSDDGRFLLQGSLINLETRENLTEKARRSMRAEAFAAIPDSDLTVYTPTVPVRYTLNVFTDPNCTYCRQFHREMRTYLNAGVKIRYFQFPVLGRQSPQIMRDIWCADDRNEAMDRAKAGMAIAESTCETPQDAHMALGREMGISGTPALVSDAGLLIPGFRPAPETLLLLSGNE